MSDGPIHSWFGLSYSNYLVLHRTMLQQMPAEWQAKLVGLLAEMELQFSEVEKPSCFIVNAAEEHEASELTAIQRESVGVTIEFPNGDDGDVGYFDKEGGEIDGWSRVLVPVDDPIPHYRHAPLLKK